MWPNMNPAKAYGTMECVFSTPELNLIVGKRYDILELDPVALDKDTAVFQYLVKNEYHQYVWVDTEYLKDFIPRS